nr:integration host factor, actinobacterial type [Streptomyces incarnatus]
MRTVDLLQAMPGVGEVRAHRIMEACEISPVRRLKGLGRRQREALIAYIGR